MGISLLRNGSRLYRQQYVLRRDALLRDGGDLHDIAAQGAAEPVLHLHGLQHQQRLSLAYPIAGLHTYLDDASGQRRLDILTAIKSGF